MGRAVGAWRFVGLISWGVAPCWHGNGPLALNSNLRDALPNASFIGFTGTPIEKADAKRRAVFGEDCRAVFVDRHTPMSWIGGEVFHLPFVKSGKSTGRLRSATDFSLRTAMELQVAAS